MKLYVLTKSSRITPLNKEIIGIFNYNDGYSKKIMLESIQRDCIYLLEGPFNVNENQIQPEFENLIFPEVPKTPLKLPNNNIPRIKNLI